MACLLALACMGPGCSPRGRDGAQIGADAGAALIATVRVPLPAGWAAAPVGDALMLGPPGRPVMRIESGRGGERLPRAAELRASFLESVDDARATTLREREDETTVLWLGRLDPRASRSGRGPMVLLAARKYGQDILLCGSIPGASDAEVELAARACEAL